MKRSLVLFMLLAGCAPKPEVQVREVPVISPVKCVDPRSIPAEPPRVAQRFNGNAKHDLELLAENAQDLRAWGQEMRTLLEKCVGKAPPQ